MGSPSLGVDYYRNLLSRRLRGRKVVLAGGHVATVRGQVDTLLDLGAQRPFMLAEGIGTGRGVDDPGLDWRAIGPDRTDNLMDGLRGFEAILADLPDEPRAALTTYDPDRTALVICPLWCTLSAVDGRPVYGARRPAWVALEDKTVVDELWDRAGIARAAYRIVPAERDALLAAAADLDQGTGTVWAGDSRSGWHGGGEGTFWVRTADHADRALAALAPQCDCVRVMPFLDGLPCSIHGIVLPDRVLALRPVEMVTLRDPAASTLRYCGCATTWDPADADRETMRNAARAVGDALRDEVGFRGCFTIDGVMTADGFRPTELNPRFGAGLVALGACVPDLPLYYLHLAMCEGEAWDFRGDQLEQLVIDAADATRRAGCSAWDPMRSDHTVAHTLHPDGDGLRLSDDDDKDGAVGTVLKGPTAAGSFVSVTFAPDFVGVGQSAGPRVVQALALADAHLGTSFGSLACAPTVR